MSRHYNYDKANNIPLPRPLVGEGFHSNSAYRKYVTKSYVAQGEQVCAKVQIKNSGFYSSGTIDLDYHMSSNDWITDKNTLLLSTTTSSLNGNTFAYVSKCFNAPSSARDDYYVGAIAQNAVRHKLQ